SRKLGICSPLLTLPLDLGAAAQPKGPGRSGSRSTSGGRISHSRGLQFTRPVSFLNCVLIKSSVVRYVGSSTTVVTTSHVPPSPGKVNVRKYSVIVASP